jgi:hypothetical protein
LFFLSLIGALLDLETCAEQRVADRDSHDSIVFNQQELHLESQLSFGDEGPKAADCPET